MCFSPVGFDGSHHYPATILDLTVFLYFCISGGPETREGATFEQNFFSDICSARYSSIKNLMHFMKFQKKVLVNRSNGEFGKRRTQGKIFVGNLTLEGVTVDDVRHHFSQV